MLGMCVMLIVCCASGRVGDWYHCLVVGGEGSIDEVLYAWPPSIETKTHCEFVGGGVFPKNATDVPVQYVLAKVRSKCKDEAPTLKGEGKWTVHPGISTVAVLGEGRPCCAITKKVDSNKFTPGAATTVWKLTWRVIEENASHWKRWWWWTKVESELATYESIQN